MLRIRSGLAQKQILGRREAREGPADAAQFRHNHTGRGKSDGGGGELRGDDPDRGGRGQSTGPATESSANPEPYES